MKRIALYHVETLLWIARLGTFRAAAERLNTTQPAISARIRELEGQLGVELFRREGRRMVLTSRGRQLVRDCEPLWAQFETVLLRPGAFRGATGVVRIGAGEIAAASCLPGFVRQAGLELPGVTLEVELDLTARMVQRLLGGTSDMVFLAGPVAAPGIRTAPIGGVGLAWLASPETAAAFRAGQPLRVWSLPLHSPIHQITLETLREHNAPSLGVNTCNNARTMIEIVASGGGAAAVLPLTMAGPAMAAGTLVEVLPRPRRVIEFEAAVRSGESDPVILELFERASRLVIGTGKPQKTVA